ncbi:MAG: hypothetical protein ABR985_02000 [Methanotrichaceae archaeon]
MRLGKREPGKRLGLLNLLSGVFVAAIHKPKTDMKILPVVE